MSITDANVGQDWDEASVSAGAEITSNGQLRLLDQRVVNDNFNESAIDAAVWGTVLAGTGSFVLNGPLVDYIEQRKRVTTATASLYLKSVIDQTNPFRIKMAFTTTAFTDPGIAWMLSGYSAPPTVNDLGTFKIYMFRSSLNTISIVYVDSVGSTWNWNGSAWQAGAFTFSMLAQEWKYAHLISDGTSWRIRFEDRDGTLITETSPITWANTLPLGGGESAYFITHDIRNSAVNFDLWLSSVQRWATEAATTYLTSAQSCTTETLQITEAFDSGDVRFKTSRVIAAGTEIKLYANIDGAGFGAAINVNTVPVAGLTGVYQFTAGTALAPATNVILKLEINSPSSDTQIEVSVPWVDGVTVTGGAVCDYPATSNVRNGIVYNNTLSTGSAHIPVAADTRKDTPVDNTVGTLAVPGPDNVRENIPTDATVGNYVPADEDKYAQNQQYGANGTEFTGSKTVTQFLTPVEIILEDPEIIIFEGCD